MSAFLLPFIYLVFEIGVQPLVKTLKKRGFSNREASLAALLIAGLGFNLIPWLVVVLKIFGQLSFIEPLEIAVVIVIAIAQLVGIPLLVNYYLKTKRTRLIAQYRSQQPNLIKP